MKVSDYRHSRQSRDDTRMLQAAIDSWLEDGGTLFCDQQQYEIEDTIKITRGRPVGGQITCRGRAASAYWRGRPGVNELGSRLVWHGPDDGRAMIEYDGDSLSWDGPALWGNRDENNEGPVGFKLLEDRGLGTGEMIVDQLKVGGCRIALHSVGHSNGDMFYVRYFELANCGKGFRSESSQNVGNLFGYVKAHTAGEVFSFKSLTQTTVQHIMVNRDIGALLESEQSGGEAGHFAIQSGKVDRAAAGVLLWNCLAPHSNAQVVFGNFVGWQCRAQLAGSLLLTFRDCQLVTSANSITARGLTNTREAVVRFDGGRGNVTDESVFVGPHPNARIEVA